MTSYRELVTKVHHEREQKIKTEIAKTRTLVLLFFLAFTFFLARVVFAQTLNSTPVTHGYRDFNYGSTPHNAVTAEKPMSKLWWTDGFWWGYMWDKDAGEYKIHRFNKDDPSWTRMSGTGGEDRSNTLVDVLWDDDSQKLYVASHKFESSGPSLLWRYSYNASTNTYSPDSGFPVEINDDGPEALTITKDSTGQLWAAWMVSGKVWINRSQGSDTNWGSPFQLPVQGGNASSDDICAITTVYGNRIGLMWSNQSQKKTYFALHLDSSSDTSWEDREDALADANLGKMADDHINFGMNCDDSGNVYAVVKTSLSGGDAPRIMVIRRDSDGDWTRYEFGDGNDNHTRAILLIDSENRKLYVFAKSGNSSNGVIRMKSSDLDNINFSSGLGTIVLESNSDDDINDPSSTKQCLDGNTNLLIIASDEGSKNYMHYFADLAGGGNGPDIAVSPTEYDYGIQLTGSNTSQEFAIDNEGNDDLDVDSITLEGTDADQFEITSGGGSFTLPDGQTHYVEVTFSPTSTGIKNAILRIENNDINEDPTDIPLTGHAVDSFDPDITVVPSSFDYGNVFETVGIPQTFMVYNDGVNDLDVSSSTTTGSPDFAITSGDGGFTLAAGDSHAIEVTFTPSSTTAKSGNLRIFSNDPDESTLDVPLSGTGIEIPASSGEVAFEEVENGTGSGLSVTTGADLTGFPGHFYVAAICYRGNGGNVISVSGLGLGWTQVEEQCSGRGNTGVEIWVGVGQPNGNGTVTATFGSSVTNSVISVVRYSGVNLDEPIGDIVAGNSNGEDGNCSGGTDTGSYSFTLNASLPGSAIFGAAALRNRSHTPGANYTERVELAAGSGGDAAGMAIQDQELELPGPVDFNGTFSSNVDWAAIGLELLPGGENPDIAVTPTSYDYGDIFVGDDSTKIFTIRNNGNADLDVTSISIEGSDASEFQIISGGGAVTLGPDETQDVEVSFIPSLQGVKNADLRIDSNDAGNTMLLVALTGNGQPPPEPEIVVSPESHNYGDVYLGVTAQQTIAVTNVGSQDLEVTGTSIGGTNPGDFTVISGGGVVTIAPGDTQNILVEFEPAALGARSATLSIASNDADEDPFVVVLSGNGIPVVPDIVLSTTTLDFSDVIINTTDTLTLSIYNEGVANLNVSATGFSGSDAGDFDVSSGDAPFTLAPGDTQILEITFTPSSLGGKTAKLTISSDDPDETDVEVDLTGNGVPVPTPNIVVSPTSHDFGDVIENTSVSQDFLVENTGDADLNISATDLTGSTAFQITGGGGAFTLAPGTSQNVSVAFNPVSIGSRSGTLTISSDDSDEPSVDIPLAGVGVELPPEVSYQETQNGTTTGGTSVITDSNLSGVAGSLYLAAIATRPSANVVSVSGLGLVWTRVDAQCPGRSQTSLELWQGTGTPTGDGQVFATFTSTVTAASISVSRYIGVNPDTPITAVVSGNTNGLEGACSGGSDNNSYSFPINVNLPGSVVYSVAGRRNRTHTPGSGYTELAEVEVGSGGDVAGLSSQTQIFNNSGGQTVNGQFESDVDWAIIAVAVQPGAVSSEPNIAVSPISFDFGDVRVDSSVTQVFLVENTGNEDLNISSFNINGDTEFQIMSGGTPGAIPAGGSQNVEISYSPLAVAANTASLEIASDDPDEPLVSVPLQGDGVIPDISISEVSHDFGEVNLNVTASHSFEIGNSGSGTVTVSLTELLGTDAAAFNVNDGAPFTVAPGASHFVEVEFTPTTTGAKSATLRLTSDDPDEGQIDVTLTGTGTIPDISVEPASIDFADVLISETGRDSVVIHNDGNDTLFVSATNLSGADSGNFSVVGGGAFSVLPTDSQKIYVEFTPPDAGPRNATLVILSDDPDEGTVNVALTGNGITGPTPDIASIPDSLKFGELIVGNATSSTFKVFNEGTAELNVTDVSLGGTDAAEFSMTSGPTSFTLAIGDTQEFEISFSPTSVGEKNGLVQFTSDDPDENPFDVTLTGTSLPVPAPEIAVTPESHDFGNVPVDSTDSQIFKIYNSGTADLNVSAIVLGGTNSDQFGFVINNAPFTIAPGDSEEIEVSFTPTSLGGKVGSIQITNDDSDESSLEIALSGAGALPEILVSPTSWVFGDVALGSTGTKSFTIENEGGAPLTVAGLSLDGTDAAEFEIVGGGSGFVLAPGDSQLVEVNFSPTTLGAKTATFVVESDDADEGTTNVALSGTGIEQLIPGEVVFEEIKTGGSASLSQVSTSAAVTGVSGDLYIASISFRTFGQVSSVTGLGLTWTHLQYQCGGRDQTAVDVWYAMGTPSGDGIVTANFSSFVSAAVIAVSRYSGVDDTSPLGTIVHGNSNGLNGTCSGGSDQSSYSFAISTTVDGAMVYGTSALRNRSHEPGAGFVERAEEEAGSGGNTAGVAVQDQFVDVAASLSLAGSFSSDVDFAVIGFEIVPGTVSGGGSSPEITVAPLSHDFGATAVGSPVSQMFAVSNDGNATLQVNDASIFGGDASDFTITNGGAPFSVTPGTSHNIEVTFSPATIGNKNTTLQIFSNDADESQVDVSLSGSATAAPAPDISASPMSHNYGNVNIGASLSQVFKVTNIGTADLNVSAIDKSGADPGSFSIIIGGAPFTVSPGDTHEVEVAFTPQSAGVKTANLEIQSNDPDSSTITIVLSGTGGSPVPEITVTPTSIDFGDVVENESAFDTLEVRNDGSANLNVSATDLTGAQSTSFVIEEGGGAFVLAPAETRLLVVSFNPTTVGARTANLEISNDDSDENPVVVQLDGNGVVAPTPDITLLPTSYDFGDVATGTSPSTVIEIHNDGDADLVVSASEILGADALEFDITAGGGAVTIEPGNSHDIEVTFAPVTEGDKTATLSITSNDPDDGTITLPLDGSGIEPPPIGDVAYEENQSGGDSATSTISTDGSMTAVAGDLYLAAIGYRPFGEIASVTGLGLTWTRVRMQCAGRDQAAVEVWRAIGSPGGSSAITVNFTSNVDAAVVSVSRFSGVDPADPVGNIVSGNTNGENGTCSGGTDGDNYSFNITATSNGSMIFGAATMRNRSHSASGGFAERAELEDGSGGNVASVAVQDQFITTAGSVTMAGTFSRAVDWAVISVEIRPGASSGGSSDVPDIAVSPDSHDFGSVTVNTTGSHTFTVSNEGTADLNVTNVSLVGGDNSDFAIASGGTSFTIAPGDDHNIDIDFTPTSVGDKSTTLRFASDDPDEGSFDVALSGNGTAVPEPDIAVNDEQHDFGDVFVGADAAHTFIISNAGSADLNVTATNITGADFAVTQGGGAFTLTPGDTHHVEVTFAPGTTGAKSGALSLPSDDPDENPLEIDLSGNGLAALPDIAAAPGSLDFPDVVAGNSALDSVIISNEGVVDLDVTATEVSGADATDFTILSGGGSFTLTPSSTQTIRIEFGPSVIGGKTAELKIASNDPDEDTLSVALSGAAIATPEPDITVTPLTFDYGDVIENTSSSHTFAVENEGTADLNVSASSISGDGTFTITGGAGAFSLTPGETHDVEVTFSPVAVGSQSATLEITSDDPDEGLVEVDLSGEGIAQPVSSDVVFEEVQSGADTSTAVVTTFNDVTAVSGHFYIAAISYRKPNESVVAVSGLGLTWSEIMSQCGGRGQVGLSVWVASGTPSADGTVSATFSDDIKSAAIAVSRYSGVNLASPLGSIVSVNTNGELGDCSGGTDSGAYSFNLTTTTVGAMVYAAINPRNRIHTPDGGYTEHVQQYGGSFGDQIAVAVMDQSVTSPGDATVAGSFNNDADWAVVSMEILPASGSTSTLSLNDPNSRKTDSGDLLPKSGNGVLIFGTTDDAYVKSSSRSMNYGGRENLRIRTGSGIYRSYLKFEVAGIEGQIKSARLRLYVKESNPDGGKLFTTSSGFKNESIGWTESRLVWENAPEFNMKRSFKIENISADAWVEIDVSSIVKGNGVYSFGMSSESSNSVFFSSKEGGYPPQLAVEIAADETDKDDEYRKETLDTPELPVNFALYPNYPNPFNAQTTILYDLATASRVTLIVYNARGQEVIRLLDGHEEAGSKRVQWDGRNSAGVEVGSGVYFLHLKAGKHVFSQKLTLQK